LLFHCSSVWWAREADTVTVDCFLSPPQRFDGVLLDFCCAKRVQARKPKDPSGGRLPPYFTPALTFSADSLRTESPFEPLGKREDCVWAIETRRVQALSQTDSTSYNTVVPMLRTNNNIVVPMLSSCCLNVWWQSNLAHHQTQSFNIHHSTGLQTRLTCRIQQCLTPLNKNLESVWPGS